MMTDSEISLKIAESIEPKPGDDAGRDGFTHYSRLKAWIRGPVKNGKYQSWDHRDFVNDPAMTVMLMSRPDFVDITRSFISGDEDQDHPDDGYYAQFCPRDIHSPKLCTETFAMAHSSILGRAVAEAFYKRLP